MAQSWSRELKALPVSGWAQNPGEGFIITLSTLSDIIAQRFFCEGLICNSIGFVSISPFYEIKKI